MEAEFELELRGGVRARTLRGLLSRFDLGSVLDAYWSGELERWLESCGSWQEARRVRALDPQSPSLRADLCRALGLDAVSSAQLVLGLNDPAECAARAERLRAATDDEDVLGSLDCVAFSQRDLDNLASLRPDQIFLCGKEFTIPRRPGNILYIGIGEPLARFEEGHVSPGIDCTGVRFDAASYVRDFVCWVSLEEHGCYYFPEFWDNLELGVKVLTQAADEDDARAQTLLAACWRERYGTVSPGGSEPLMLDARSSRFRAGQAGAVRNQAEAAKWALWASGQEHPGGMCLLASLCQYGLGVPEDPKKAERLNQDAFRLFREQAERGDAPSQMNLAWCWFYGIGTESNEQVAMQWLESSAMLGFAPAQCELADAYREGGALSKDLAKAFFWYQKAAEQGDARGLAHLADFYYFGDVVKSHEPKAVQLYREAARKGSQHAQKRLVECCADGFGTEADPGAASYWRGKVLDQEERFMYKYGWTGKTLPADVRAENKRNYRHALRRARQGDLDALCDLAWEHVYGFSSEPDYQKARELFRMAVQRDHAPSMYGLGRMYEQGLGGAPDDERAARCYRNAASHGDVQAQMRLASMYAEGRGVPQDQEKAVYWYRQAADDGYRYAQFVLGQRYAYGRGVPEDPAQAACWLGRAAEQGDANAQCSLAAMFLEGDGVPLDPAEAARLFRQAATQGNVSAQLYLGMMYAEGNGVERSPEKAARWYALAAEKGDLTAQNHLGYCYYYGTGVEQDYAKAVGCYERSAFRDDPWAMTSLAYCYYNGTGVERDLYEAMFWFQRAADLGSEDARVALQSMTEEEVSPY